MNISKKKYPEYADAHAPRSSLLADCLRAFLFGGLICTLSEALSTLWLSLGMPEKDAGLLTSVLLIFFAVLLTAIGAFDKLAKLAGAGTLVPITGFANAVASSAIDNRAEGMVLGLGAKIFTVAGPVLLYGIVSGTVYGVIYWIISLF